MPLFAPTLAGERGSAPVSLPALRRLAGSVAAEEGGTLGLLGTMTAEGSADYVEVMFGDQAPSDWSRTLVITVKRRLTEPELRQRLRHGLRAHLRKTA